jgi:pyrroline-5-carboxylate reductase
MICHLTRKETMVEEQQIEKLAEALKVISEALQLLDKRITDNTTLISTIAGIDIEAMRKERDKDE